MRSYFWIREKSRGNVYANSQLCGLSEAVLHGRNNSVAADSQCSCSYVPKAHILHEFRNPLTFEAERDELINAMSHGRGWDALEVSLQNAIRDAATAVQNGYQAAITARAEMLNKTLIHYRQKPLLPCAPCGCTGYYDSNSHTLLVSNGQRIKRCAEACGCGLIYYHPFAWEYGYKMKPKEALSVHASHEWVCMTSERKLGNVAWSVKGEDADHAFMDFAYFKGGYCHGWPQYYSSDQTRILWCSENGIPQFAPADYKQEVWLYSCHRFCGCTCLGEFSCIIPTVADTSRKYFYGHGSDRTQNYHGYYLDFHETGVAPFREYNRVFRADTIVEMTNCLGVYTPYYRNFARERCGKTDAVDATHLQEWLQSNTINALCGGPDGAYEDILTATGRKVGIYSSADSLCCGRAVGAVLKMSATPTTLRQQTMRYAGPTEACAMVGDFTLGNNRSVPTVAWIGRCNQEAYEQNQPAQNLVTIDSRNDVAANLNLEVMCVSLIGVTAKVRFRLDAENWEDFTSAELWTQLQECMNDPLNVYFSSFAYFIPFSIDETGVTGTAEVSDGVALFTLAWLCELHGMTPTEANVGEVYELLTAGLTVSFSLNENNGESSFVGIAPDFCETPLVSCF